MIEVHLIGYTEDGEQLVFDLDPDGEGRYVLAVDPDLLATVVALREARVAHGRPVDARPDEAREPAAVPPATAPGPAAPDGAEVREPAPPVAVPGPSAPAEADAAPRAGLSPAEIQRRLRSGRSVAAVATEAGVEPGWIERWLPPILAERERVLRDAWTRGVGDVDDPLRGQVETALAARGAPPERTVWSAARRADGRWRVSVRFPEDGRSRSATWTMRAEGGSLSPASPLAAELYPADRRRRKR